MLGRSVLKTVWNAPYNIRFFYKRNHITPDPASKPDRKPAASVGKPAAPERAAVPERSAVKKKPVANRFAFLFDDDEWGCLLKKQAKTRYALVRVNWNFTSLISSSPEMMTDSEAGTSAVSQMVQSSLSSIVFLCASIAFATDSSSPSFFA